MLSFNRSEYFKTALSWDVDSNNKKTLDVKEFSYQVLSTAVDFMCGREIPEEFNDEDDLRNLLHMADLYLMEDLKDAAGFIISKSINMENVFDISKVADKFRATFLSEECAKFLYDNHASIDEDKFAEMGEGTVMAALAKKFVKESKESWMNKLFGSKPGFKRREDFKDMNDYTDYVASKIQPKMFVRCNHTSVWNGYYVTKSCTVTEGHIGFTQNAVHDAAAPGEVTWQVKIYFSGYFER